MAQSPPNQYQFDDEFVEKLVALLVRDQTFAQATQGVIKSEYFQSDRDALIVSIVLEYFDKYRASPSQMAICQEIVKKNQAGIVRGPLAKECITYVRSLSQVGLTDRQYIIDGVVDFAKHTEMSNAILNSVQLLQNQDYDGIEKLVRDALNVGSSEAKEYDYLEEAENRVDKREAIASGAIQKTGITTGCMEIDNWLQHGGYGRKELSIWAGFLKSGKSMALIHAAMTAWLTGHNVLYVSLENSLDVTSDRMDAYVTGIPTRQLGLHPQDVKLRLDQHKQSGKCGRLIVEEFASGTWTPRDADRLIQKHKAKGLVFDEFVVDYLDLMAPSRYTKDKPIEDSKNIWTDMRAIAQRENLALVSATQTNREGGSSSVAEAKHVADDINKMRIADLAFTINRDENDRKNDTARIFMAAGRNQADCTTLRIQQDLSRARFIVSVLP